MSQTINNWDIKLTRLKTTAKISDYTKQLGENGVILYKINIGAKQCSVIIDTNEKVCCIIDDRQNVAESFDVNLNLQNITTYLAIE